LGETNMKTCLSVLVSIALSAASCAFAKDAPKANPFDSLLSSVPSAELPAKSADLVLHAKARDRHATTVDVVRGAIGINPAAAPAIVGAIARVVPEMAAVAAGTAAAEQPKQAAAIAKAAAAAAPSKAGKIVNAVCLAVPNEYRSVAVAVAQVAPNSNKDILKAVASALPDLKPSLDQVLAGRGGSTVSVSSALDQAATVTRSTSATASAVPILATPVSSTVVAGAPVTRSRGPAVGPPYIPLTGTPTNVTSGTSGEVPTGGRDYAAP
jgi:hypothetical protein